MAGVNTLPMVWSPSTSGRTEHHGHPHSPVTFLRRGVSYQRGTQDTRPEQACFGIRLKGGFLMSIAYVVVTLLAAAFIRAKWVVEALTDYSVPHSWWPWLGTAKAAGAAGLLVGLFVPVIGVMAGIGLVLYFAGAVVTVVRARCYSNIPYPLLYLAPVVAALALGFAA